MKFEEKTSINVKTKKTKDKIVEGDYNVFI